MKIAHSQLTKPIGLAPYRFTREEFATMPGVMAALTAVDLKANPACSLGRRGPLVASGLLAGIGIKHVGVVAR